MAPSRRRVSGRTRRYQNLADRTGADHSGILLVLALAADDIGDVIALVLVGLQEGVVFAARVLGDLDVVLALGDLILLAALGLGVRLLERNELDLRSLRRCLNLGGERRYRRGRRRRTATARGEHHRVEYRLA